MMPKLNSKTVFVIIEGHPKRPILPVLYDLESQPHWRYLFADTEWGPYQSESPLLIQTDAGSPFLQRVMDDMQSPNGWLGLILESTEDFDTVLSWAQQRLTVALAPPRTGLLRYYDPLIWHALCTAGGRIGETIQHGHYWLDDGDAGCWHTSAKPEPVAEPATSGLSPEQYQALASLASRTNSGQVTS
ncbi:DUF4123 domain-containing protein [Marinobacter fonticola]|uniref:DUF4123 domain-containing protein n=1 Tax=Marinobacter fonticola TaxID=2603215 RepID=UPI0011E6E68D|nr:DUF4123 domain-containing protein [Marinobacter fonticola]